MNQEGLKQLEKNRELELAWEYVTQTSMNVFLTGKAGTGKTTFLKMVVDQCPKRKIVLAPTGVAAINAGGVTLHSFFQLPFGLFLPDFQHVQAHDRDGRYKFHKKKLRMIRSMELMIIDEVSMLRADVMDELDALLRKLRRNPQPFGGVQVLMIGDVQQLSPVVRPEEWEVMAKYYESPYFFDSKVLKEHPYRMVELTHIFRQRDSEFIDILAAVRENRMTPALLERLNARYVPDYQAPEGCITLCTHNSVAKQINDSHLEQIPSSAFTYEAVITGNFPESMYPQEVELVLKKGAQVMFTKNDPDRLYVNGTLGTVISIGKEHITVRLENGGEVEVEPQPWENLKYDINEETKEIVSEIDGLFTQYPLKTAWAITIHKSQGLTFDKAVIDANNSFSHGQVYVALSRCRTLEGLVLKRKIPSSAIINDHRVDEYSDYVSESLPTLQNLEADKRTYYLEVLKELFNLEGLARCYHTYFKFARVAFPGLYPKALAQWSNVEPVVDWDLTEVGTRFGYSLNKIVLKGYCGRDRTVADTVAGGPVGMSPEAYSYLQTRVKAAAEYFRKIVVEKLLPLVRVAYSVDFDDKDKKKLHRQYSVSFAEMVFQKLFLWNYVSVGFDLDSFLKEKSILSGEVPETSVTKLLGLLSRAIVHPGISFVELAAQNQKEEVHPSEYERIEEVSNPELFEKLRRWRSEEAKKQNVPCFQILHQKTLVAIVNAMPTTKAELLAVKGVGNVLMKKYGETILTLIHGEEAPPEEEELF